MKNFNSLIHNVQKGQTLAANSARFLECVWPFLGHSALTVKILLPKLKTFWNGVDKRTCHSKEDQRVSVFRSLWLSLKLIVLV